MAQPVAYTFRVSRMQPYGTLYTCDACCALTDDPDGHAAWHENVKPPRKQGERIEKGPG